MKNRALILQLLAQGGGVGQIAVVGDSQLPPFAVPGQRLGVAQMGRAGGRITGMAHGHVAGQIMQDLGIKDLRNQPHAFVFPELGAIA